MAEDRAVVKQLLCNFLIPQDSRLLQEHLFGALNWDTVWLHPRYKHYWRHSSRCTLCKRRTLDSRVGSQRSFTTTYWTSSPLSTQNKAQGFFLLAMYSLSPAVCLFELGHSGEMKAPRAPKGLWTEWAGGHPQWFLELWPHPQAKVPFPDVGGLKTNDL